MKQNVLGNTGLKVSEIAFGGAPIGLTNYLGEWEAQSSEALDQSQSTVLKALAMGITYFDTAPGYGNGLSERILGKALAGTELPHIVATKVGDGDFTYDHIMTSVKDSLNNLQVDTIDVYQLHGNIWQESAVQQVFEEGGLEALAELKQNGKIRFSGFTTESGTAGAFRLLRSGYFDVLQVAYNILYQDACNMVYHVKSGLIVEAKERGMGVVTMRTMTSGIFQKIIQDQYPDIDTNYDLYQLPLNYVLSNPYVDSAIIGMRHPDEVVRNVKAVTTMQRLDLEEVHRRYEL